MTNQNQNFDVENQIEQLFQTIQPGQDFKHRLEAELLAKPSAIRPRFFLKLRFAAPALIVATLAIAFLVIGPARVMAEARKLLSYLPGIGYADAERTRVLVQPVESWHNGVKLRIDKVVAVESQVKVWFRMSGPSLTSDPFNHPVEFSNIYLLLPDGSISKIYASGRSLKDGYAEGYFESGWIPSDVNRLVLVIPQPSSVSPGEQGDEWKIPFEIQAPREVIQPLLPANNSVTDSGITLTINSVARSTTDTGISLHVDWDDADLLTFAGLDLNLFDEQGQVYKRLETIHLTEEQYLPGVGYAPSREQRLRYAPLEPGEQQVTLRATRMVFKANKSEVFRFDPGDSPSDGQRWDLESQPGSLLKIGGIPVQLQEARLVRQKTEFSLTEHENITTNYDLAFRFRILTVPGRDFASAPGVTIDHGGNILNSSTSIEEDGTILLIYHLRELQPIEIQFEDTLVQINGTWEVKFELP
jgi:hypothetical protein